MPDFIKIPNESKLYQAADTENIKATVGGKNCDNFAPSANMSFKMQSGKEQYFFNICDDTEQVKTVGKSEDWNGNKLRILDGDQESTFELFDTSLKIERVFYTKPTEKPRFKLTHSPGIIPYKQKSIFEDYQDLVQYWVAKGESPSDLPESFDEYSSQHGRPDNVVGSYAIYCDKQNHIRDKAGNTIVNYANGKVGHIYAVYWKDAEDKIIKADQNIIGSFLECDLPSQEWIDTAVLPIKLDPDIGYTTAGASEFYPSEGRRYGVKYTTGGSESGTLSSMSIAWRNDSGSFTRSVACGLYEGTTPGSVPDAGEIESAQKAVGYNTKNDETNDFLEIDFSSESFSISSSTDYWLAAQYYNSLGEAPSGDSVFWFYDTTPTQSLRFSVFSDPWVGIGSASGFTYNLSIFFTYTVDSGLLPIISNLRRQMH